jgi:hypothetical protein
MRTILSADKMIRPGENRDISMFLRKIDSLGTFIPKIGFGRIETQLCILAYAKIGTNPQMLRNFTGGLPRISLFRRSGDSISEKHIAKRHHPWRIHVAI